MDPSHPSERQWGDGGLPVRGKNVRAGHRDALARGRQTRAREGGARGRGLRPLHLRSAPRPLSCVWEQAAGDHRAEPRSRGGPGVWGQPRDRAVGLGDEHCAWQRRVVHRAGSDAFFPRPLRDRPDTGHEGRGEQTRLHFRGPAPRAPARHSSPPTPPLSAVQSHGPRGSWRNAAGSFRDA